MAITHHDDPLIDDVLAKVRTWESLDFARIADDFTQDGVLHSMMGTPIKGRANILKIISRHFGDATGLEMNVLAAARAGDLVFLERVDSLYFGDKRAVVPIIGVVEMRGGKVAAWREYYDLQQAMPQ
ncbi:MAG: limonene-1,2-epoxide hydrolase family protein [Sphingomonadales bacterium]